MGPARSRPTILHSELARDLSEGAPLTDKDANVLFFFLFFASRDVDTSIKHLWDRLWLAMLRWRLVSNRRDSVLYGKGLMMAST